MTQRFRLDLPTPATGFMDSLLIGNGRLGATLAGRIGEEQVDINLDRFWSGGPEAKPKARRRRICCPSCGRRLRREILRGPMR